MLQRALGDVGFDDLPGASAACSETYTLTAVQADAILRMTLGQLVNLEQEKLADEYQEAAGRRFAEYQPHPLRRQNILRHHPRRPARS